MNNNNPDPKSTRMWTAKSIGKKWQHVFFYVLIGLLGRRPAYAFMRVVCLWYVGLYPFVRAKCAPYLSRRFPERTGFVKRFIDCYRIVTSLGETLIDRAAFGILGPQSFDIAFDGAADIRALLAEGKGLIIVNAHVGCWQVALSLLRHFNVPVSAVMQMHEGDVDRRYYEHSGDQPPFRVIDPEAFLGGILEMAQVLQRGEILGVMGDRVFGADKNTVGVQFLGEEIHVPITPYRLSSVTRAPIVVILSRKESYRRYSAEVACVIRPPSGLGRKPAAYTAYAQAFADTLDAYAQAHPWQFFNFYDMWYHRTPWEME